MAKTIIKTLTRKTSVSRKKVRQVIAEISKFSETTKLAAESKTSKESTSLSSEREASKSK